MKYNDLSGRFKKINVKQKRRKQANCWCALIYLMIRTSYSRKDHLVYKIFLQNLWVIKVNQCSAFN